MTAQLDVATLDRADAKRQLRAFHRESTRDFQLCRALRLDDKSQREMTPDQRALAERVARARHRIKHLERELARVWVVDAQGDAEVNRNDPCPCGSGAKFKRCHGGAR